MQNILKMNFQFIERAKLNTLADWLWPTGCMFDTAGLKGWILMELLLKENLIKRCSTNWMSFFIVIVILICALSMNWHYQIIKSVTLWNYSTTIQYLSKYYNFYRKRHPLYLWERRHLENLIHVNVYFNNFLYRAKLLLFFITSLVGSHKPLCFLTKK